jgi:histidinol-phosphate aminotransferase
VTIGTEKEVTRFLAELKSVLAEIHSGKIANGAPNGVEEKKEQEASGVVA